MIGPPRFAPNWFWSLEGLATPARFEKKSFASKESFR
jgi:hypothetical protein